MKSYLNNNGLEDGNIPVGKPCPFLANCRLRNDSCPNDKNPRTRAYSCAMARLHSMIAEEAKDGVRLPIMEAIRDGGMPLPISLLPKPVGRK